MLSISFSEEFFIINQNATIGFLEISGVYNSLIHDPFEKEKLTIEELLRNQYKGSSRTDFNTIPIISAYRRYYKKFKKSYHVQMQIESIALKGKSLPHINPLVDVNFMSEVQTMVLTSGHDVDTLHGPISMDISREGDVIPQLNGQRRTMRTGDMIMRDGESTICSVIYGQDNHSLISKDTTHVLFVAYCPEGVPLDRIDQHFEFIRTRINSFSPSAKVVQLNFKHRSWNDRDH